MLGERELVWVVSVNNEFREVHRLVKAKGIGDRAFSEVLALGAYAVISRAHGVDWKPTNWLLEVGSASRLAPYRKHTLARMMRLAELMLVKADAVRRLGGSNDAW